MNNRPPTSGLLLRVLLCCLILLSAASCGPASPQPSDPDAPPSAPDSVRQPKTLELGDVEILTYG